MNVTDLDLKQQVASIFLSYFGRATEYEAMAWYVEQLEALRADHDVESAYKLLSAQIYVDGVRHGEVPAAAGITDAEYVRYVYRNVFGREADSPGFHYWLTQLATGHAERAELVALMINAALNGDDARDRDYILNRTSVSVEFAQWENSNPQILDSLYYDAKEVLEGVDETPESVDAAIYKITVENKEPPVDTKLTIWPDYIEGTYRNEVFYAPAEQNPLGESSLTLQSGDYIDGGGGRDILLADLQGSATNDGATGTVISPATKNVEVVKLRQQGWTKDQTPNWSTIDAEQMEGVEEWWSYNSRGNIQIEDIRERPENVTIGMESTDGFYSNFPTSDFPFSELVDKYNVFMTPGASLQVLFSPDQLVPVTTARDSKLIMRLDSTHTPGDLSYVKIDGFTFVLGGVPYTIRSEAIGMASNHDELTLAIREAMDGIAGLEGVKVERTGSVELTLTDPQGRAFQVGTWTFIDGQVPADGDAYWNQVVEPAIIDTHPVSTHVVIDDVGRGAQGGVLNIAGMNDAGVAVFDVAVDRDSWLSHMISKGSFGRGTMFLETVVLTNIGAQGDLTVGHQFKGVPGELDGRTSSGLCDVREVLTDNFVGQLVYSVVLTHDAFNRYLNHATEEVLFTYEGGENDDNITIEEAGLFEHSDAVSHDVDFAMQVDLKAGDDRLNLDLHEVAAVRVDGGAGYNTIAVRNSHGTTARNTFESFSNFQHYEIEGRNDTEHDFTNMPGVEVVEIATAEDTSTRLYHLESQTDVVITGKNQTLRDGNANQSFATIRIDGVEDEELTVTLDNTARFDGELWINNLTVLDSDPRPLHTLNVVSNGIRDTSNVIASLVAPTVSDASLNLLGTQDLAIRVNQLGATTPVKVDASQLKGQLTLALDPGRGSVPPVLNNGWRDVVMGTEGNNDRLQLWGEQVESQNTRISGFEIIQFGGAVVGGRVEQARGVFNAENVRGVNEIWNIRPSADLGIIHLSTHEDGHAPLLGLRTIGGGIKTGIVYAAGQRVTEQNVIAEDVGWDDNEALLTVFADALETVNLNVTAGVYLVLGGDAANIRKLNIEGGDQADLAGDDDFRFMERVDATRHTGDLTLDVGGSLRLVSVHTGIGDDAVLVNRRVLDGSVDIDLGAGTNVLGVEDKDDLQFGAADIETLNFNGVTNVDVLYFDNQVVLDRNATLNLGGFDTPPGRLVFNDDVNGAGHTLGFAQSNEALVVEAKSNVYNLKLDAGNVTQLSVVSTNEDGVIDILNVGGPVLETLAVQQQSGDGQVRLHMSADAGNDVSRLREINIVAVGDINATLAASDAAKDDFDRLANINVQAEGDATLNLSGTAGMAADEGQFQIYTIEVTANTIPDGILKMVVDDIASDVKRPQFFSYHAIAIAEAMEEALEPFEILTVEIDYKLNPSAPAILTVKWPESDRAAHTLEIDTSGASWHEDDVFELKIDNTQPGREPQPMVPGEGFEALEFIHVEADEDAYVDLVDVYGGFDLLVTAGDDADVHLANTQAASVTVTVGDQVILEAGGDTIGNWSLEHVTVEGNVANIDLKALLYQFKVLDVSGVTTALVLDARDANFGFDVDENRRPDEYVNYLLGNTGDNHSATVDVELSGNTATREVYAFIGDDIQNVVINNFTPGADPAFSDRIDLSYLGYTHPGQLVVTKHGSDIVVTDGAGGPFDFSGSITVVGAAAHIDPDDFASLNIIYA